jgi:SanA protein
VRWALLVAMLSIAAVIACDRRIAHEAAPYVHSTLDALPVNEVGLVLGTSDRLRSGAPNPFFAHRIAAAARLIRSGKVSYLLVSGDNSTLSYNEPWKMRRALMAAGVDSARIVLDYAGFRTLDSVVRAKEVFGQRRITIISQRFHNERAVFIARRCGIDAVGYNAADAPAWTGLRTLLRERLARVRVMLDLWLGTEPRFLGEPVPIGG